LKRCGKEELKSEKKEKSQDSKEGSWEIKGIQGMNIKEDRITSYL